MLIRNLRLTAGLFLVLTILASCGGGGEPTPKPGETKVPLTIVSFVASTLTGPSPLGVTFTVTVSGGTLPITYYWDFDGDGAYDFTNAPSGSRKATAYRQFLLRAEDVPTGSSVYKVTVTAVDDDNARVTSGELTVTVTSAPQFTVEVDVTSDYVMGFRTLPGGGQEPIYAYLSGKPVYFRASVQTSPGYLGSATFTYAWDFDGDGRVDSSLPNPQYTFTLSSGQTRMTFYPTLTLIDSQGLKVVWTPAQNPSDPDYPYVVVREVEAQPSGPPKLIISSYPPIEQGKIINVSYNPESDNPDERVPRLSVSASVDILQPGTPPYSFSWDFTSDGIIDATTPQAGVPYYDPDLDVVVNPYLLTNVFSKDFTLTFWFRDASGYEEKRTYTVSVKNLARPGELNPLNTRILVDLDGNDTFDTTTSTPIEEQQYKLLGAGDVIDYTVDPVTGEIVFPSFSVKVQVKASGSTGTYRFAADPLGIGVWAEDVNNDGILDWNPLGTGLTPVEWNNDPSSIDAKVELSPEGNPDTALFTFTYWGGLQSTDERDVQFPGAFLPGFKAIQVRVTAIDAGGFSAASVTSQVPICLAVVSARPFAAGSAEPVGRTDFGFVGVTTPEARMAFIVGGMDGNFALRSSQLITQVWDPNLNQFAGAFLLRNILPLVFPAGQLGAGSLLPDPTVPNSFPARVFVFGGFNNTDLTTSAIESLSTTVGPNTAWVTEGTIGDNDTALRYMGVIGFGNAFMLLGGLVGEPGNESVSDAVRIYFLPGTPNSFWVTNPSYAPQMPTPRYDFAAVLLGEYVYVIGGRSNDGRSLSSVERLLWNTSFAGAGSWQAVPDMNFPRAGCTAQVIDGKIYVFGGAVYPPGGAGTPGFLDVVEVFNPERGTWSLAPPLPAGPLSGAGSAKFPSNKDANGNWYAWWNGQMHNPYDTVWVYGGLRGDAQIGEPIYSTTLMEYYLEDWRNLL